MCDAPPACSRIANSSIATSDATMPPHPTIVVSTSGRQNKNVRLNIAYRFEWQNGSDHRVAGVIIDSNSRTVGDFGASHCYLALFAVLVHVPYILNYVLIGVKQFIVTLNRVKVIVIRIAA